LLKTKSDLEGMTIKISKNLAVSILNQFSKLVLLIPNKNLQFLLLLVSDNILQYNCTLLVEQCFKHNI